MKMKPYNSIFLLAAAISCTFFAGFGVEASGRTVSDISAAPVSSPASSPVGSPANAPIPAPEDFNIDFQGFNAQDFIPKLQQIPNYDFSYLPVDATAKDLCDSTDYVNECIATILPELQKRGAAAAAGDGKQKGVKKAEILRMETHALYNKTNATLQYAKRLMNDGSTAERVKKPLRACADNYESLLKNLKDATKAADGGDYSRLETVLSATITEVSTCSDAFSEVPDTDSPLADLDDFLKKLCSNVLAISQMIQNK